MPPATTTSNSPAPMSWSASAIASSPDRQTLLTSSDGHAHRDAGLDRGLPRRHLPGAGLQHLPEHDVVDLVAGDAGPLQRGPDRDRAEVGAGEVAQAAQQLAHRRPRAAHDHRTRHSRPPHVGVSPFLHGTAGPKTWVTVTNVFLRIDHVGVAVPDLDEAIAWYGETFGLASVHEEVNEDQGVREAMLAVGDGTTRIQLLAPLRPDSAIATFLDRHGPASSRSRTPSRTSRPSRRPCADRGLRVLYDRARRGTAGSLVNFVHPKDAGGVLVELVQPASGQLRHRTDRRHHRTRICTATDRLRGSG
jgi:methylmalonyl-CoA/ethylmalonyl-CoA epimerase